MSFIFPCPTLSKLTIPCSACGDKHSDSDLIVAIDIERYGNLNSESSLCGKKVNIVNVDNGNTVTALIAGLSSDSFLLTYLTEDYDRCLPDLQQWQLSRYEHWHIPGSPAQAQRWPGMLSCISLAG